MRTRTKRDDFVFRGVEPACVRPKATRTTLCSLYAAAGRYFFGVGADVEIITEDIDYFAFQGDLADVSATLSGFGGDKSPYIQVPTCLLAWLDYRVHWDRMGCVFNT